MNTVKRSRYAQSRSKKAYKKGYANGFSMGAIFNSKNTYHLPQEKSLRSGFYTVEYERGFHKGYYDGLKARLPYQPFFVYDDFITSRISDEILDWERVTSNITGIINSYLDFYFKEALKKSTSIWPYDEDKFDNILYSLNQTNSSMLNYLRFELSGYFLKLLMVEATLLYDNDRFSDLSYSPYSTNYLSSLLKEYGLVSFVKADNNKRDIDWIDSIVKRYLHLLSADDSIVVKISQSRSSVWRLKKELEKRIEHVQGCSFERYKNERMNQDRPHRLPTFELLECGFELNNYITSNLIFMSLFNDCDSIESLLPMSFSPYIGFLVHNLSDKRNLFHHCVEYNRKLRSNINHNHCRDFENIAKQFSHYSQLIGILLENLENESDILHSHFVCNEFLLSTHLLHRQFFSTIECDLFRHLATNVHQAQLLRSQPHLEHVHIEKRDLNYDLLKYLHYFDIDLIDLSGYFESIDQYYFDDGLSEITHYEEITPTLRMPLLFIRNILAEVYAERGSILSNILSAFQDSQCYNKRESKERLNKLSDFICAYLDEYYNKEKNIPDLATANQGGSFPVIANLIYSVAYYDIV